MTQSQILDLIQGRINEKEKLRLNALSLGWFTQAEQYLKVIKELKSLKEVIENAESDKE